MKKITMWEPEFFRQRCKSLIMGVLEFSCFFYLFGVPCFHLHGQSARELFGLSAQAQQSGDFLKAEDFLLIILQQKNDIAAKNLIAVYNELGIINKSLGNYNRAIAYYTAGENLVRDNIDSLQFKLPSLYNNIGNVYRYLGDYKKALEYFAESVKAQYLNELSEKERGISLSHAYNNMGIAHFSQKKYCEAISFFKKSIKTRIDYGIEGVEDSYYNYANCLRELNDYNQAEINYQKCIAIRTKKYGANNYRLASVYKSLGKLKLNRGDKVAALNLYKKALATYSAGYGNIHPHTAGMYEVLGDYYLGLNQYDKALGYFQQSLIANSTGFKSNEINKNPAPGSSLSEIQLLQSLKKKSSCFIAFTE